MITEQPRAASDAELIGKLQNFQLALCKMAGRLQLAYGRGTRSPWRTACRLSRILHRLLAKLTRSATSHTESPTVFVRSPLSFDDHRSIGKQIASWRKDLIAEIDRLAASFRSSHPIARRVHLLLIRLDDLRWKLDDRLAAESTLAQWNELRLDQVYMPAEVRT